MMPLSVVLVLLGAAIFAVIGFTDWEGEPVTAHENEEMG